METSSAVSGNDESSWTDQDLQQLKEQDILKQLEALFGEHDADRFVNPKFQDERSSKLNLQAGLFQKQHYQQGAHTLWHTLRLNSTKKLVHETRDLHYGYDPPEVAEHNGMLKHVEKYRQRVELMHKIARFNEAKTRQLVQSVKLPSITADVELCKDVIFSTQTKKNLNARSSESPDSLTPSSNRRITEPSKSNTNFKGSNIRFLSEKDCTVSGCFVDRMEKLGVASNVGISRPEFLHRRSPVKHHSEPIIRYRKPEKLSASLSEKKKAKRLVRSSSWQPLTLNALAQYTNSIPAPGSGEFKRGAVEMWKPETAATDTK